MATDLQIDNELLREAQQLGNFETEKDTVNQALKEFVERHKQLAVLKLQGQIDYFDDYDHKAQRCNR